MTTRTSQKEMGDILVWELVSVRCGLAQTKDERVRRALRKQERALVGALLDMGVLAQDAMAPLPPVVTSAQPPMY
jgi:hypothetical protein